MAERRENYFETNIARFGENFIFNKSPIDIQKDALKRVFKDMIYGNIDYAKFGRYFQIPTFVDNLLAVAESEGKMQYITFIALRDYNTNHGDPDAIIRAQMHYNAFWCLMCIKNCLQTMKMNNFDVQYLTQLTADIAYGRNEQQVKQSKMDYNKIIG